MPESVDRNCADAIELDVKLQEFRVLRDRLACFGVRRKVKLKFRMCKTFLETFGSCHHQNAKHGVLTIVPTTHESSRGLYLPL